MVRTTVRDQIVNLKAKIRALQAKHNALVEKENKRLSTINKSVAKKRKYRAKLLKPISNEKRQYYTDKMNNIDRVNSKRAKHIQKYHKRMDNHSKKATRYNDKICKPYITQMQKHNGYFVRNRICPKIRLTELNIPNVIDIINDKYRNALRILSNTRGRSKYRMLMSDTTIKHIKITLCDHDENEFMSKNIASLDRVNVQLHQLYQRFVQNDSGEYLYVYAIDFFIYNPRHNNANVGCSQHRAKENVIFNLSHNEMIRMYSPRSKGNRCGDSCMYVGAKQLYPDEKFKPPIRVRQQLKFNVQSKLNLKSDIAHKIADYYNVSYRVWTALTLPNRVMGAPFHKSLRLLHTYGDVNENTLDIITLDSHAYLLKDKTVYKRQCDKCGAIRLFGVENTHKCSDESKSFNQNVIKHSDNNRIQFKTMRLDKKKNWVFFDLETFACGKGDVHRVYAVGWYDYQSKQYYYSYGKHALIEFMQWTDKHNDKQYIAYNGANFDFYFIQKMLIRAKRKPNFLKNNGRILSLKWGGEEFEFTDKHGNSHTKMCFQNSVWDLKQFTTGFSLKEACKAFKTDFQKQEFDHELMKDWDCVDKYKDDVLKYLYYDVMSLKELTEKFVSNCEREYRGSPTKYLTLSSFGENVWKSMFDDNTVVNLPTNEQMHFIGLSIYGGRTYPSQKRFKSQLFNSIIQNKDNPTKLKPLYKQLYQSSDHIFDGDINSQYPASMAGCNLMQVRYPVGDVQTIHNNVNLCTKTFNQNKKLGIYEIKFKCPNKNIKHPILPRKKIITLKNGNSVRTGIEWSLKDGQGVYNTVDIQNAVKHGYIIEFTGKALIWSDTTDNIFNAYIGKTYKHKVDATISNNKVKRAIAKLMMNALFGKMLQNTINKTEKICRTLDQWEAFSADHKITDWDVIYSKNDNVEYILVSGETIDQTKIVNKPRHLGSFILAYSRRLWLYFVENVDPTLTDTFVYYCDTDSCFMTGNAYKILIKKQLIDDNKLGYLSNDCDDNALIFYAIFLAPKCYAYHCLTQNGQIKTVIKSKGISKDNLTFEMFENEQPVNTTWYGMKRVHSKITSKQRAKGIRHFSVIKQKYDRTFYKNEWKGMRFEDNLFLPFI